MRPAATPIATARKHFAAARSMRRNVRLRRYQGRNGGGGAAVSHERAGGELARTLGRQLEGLLWSEHRLAERLSVNRDAGVDRPELEARLRELRGRIRDAG